MKQLGLGAMRHGFYFTAVHEYREHCGCSACSRIRRARQRIASGHYDRREVIEATAARVAEDVEKGT